MANIYFSNTLVSGDGSFWQAITDARDGDSVLPSPDVAWDKDIIIDFTGSGNLGRSFGEDAVIVIGDGIHNIILTNYTEQVNAMFRFTKSCTVTFNSIIFKGFSNTSSYGPCVVCNSSSGVFNITFNNCVFINNSSTASPRYGSCLSEQAGSASSEYTFNNCVFANNYATSGDNVRVASGHAVNFNNCTILNGSVVPTALTGMTFSNTNTGIASGGSAHTDVLRDKGYVCCDETGSDRLNLRLLDEGASVDLTNTDDFIIRMRAHKFDGTYTDYGSSDGDSTDIDAPSSVSYTVSDNENISLSWTANLTSEECDYLEVEYSKDNGTLWRLKAVLEQRDSRSSVTLCLNPATARTAGTSTTVSKDLDGYDRPNTGFSAGAYQDLGVYYDGYIVDNSVSSSRFYADGVEPGVNDVVFCERNNTLSSNLTCDEIVINKGVTLTTSKSVVINTISNLGKCTIALTGLDEYVTCKSDLNLIARLNINGSVRNYFAIDHSVTIDDVVLNEYVRQAWYGANIQNINAFKRSDTSAQVDVLRLDQNKYYIIEQANLGGWNLVKGDAILGQYTFVIGQGVETFRVFDGINFYSAVVGSAPAEQGGGFYNYKVQCTGISEQIPYRYEPFVLLAQIKDGNGDALDKSHVLGSQVTIQKALNSTVTPYRYYTLSQINTGTDIILNDITNYNIWQVDNEGCNLVYIADQTNTEYITSGGLYNIRVKIGLDTDDVITINTSFYVS